MSKRSRRKRHCKLRYHGPQIIALDIDLGPMTSVQMLDFVEGVLSPSSATGLGFRGEERVRLTRLRDRLRLEIQTAPIGAP